MVNQSIRPAIVAFRVALALAFSLTIPLAAQDPVRVRGDGGDEAAAIKNALIQAVQQVTGVQVYTDTISEEEFREIIRNLSENFDASLKSTQNVRLHSRGFVRSYEVVDRGRDASGRAFVELDVTVAKPGEYRADGVMTLSVFDVGLGPQIEDRDGATVLADNLVRQLRMMMTQTRQFRVLETEASREMEAILARIGSDGGFSPDERAKLGQKFSSDFVLLASIRGYRAAVMEPEPVSIGGPGGRQVQFSGGPAKLIYDLDIDYRLVDVATLQVVHTGEHLLSNGSGADPLGARPGEESLQVAAAKALARHVSDAILDHVYPMKVAEVDAEAREVYIASGGRTRLEADDVFIVYRLGREVRDPDTGELLGSRQRELGRLRIVEVQAKFSIATPIGGLDAAGVKPGDLVRRVAR